MSSFSIKLKSLWQKARYQRPFSWFTRNRPVSQEEIDKRLVYSLSPRKIPNGEQFRHLSRFLKPREYLVVKIAFLVLLVNLAYLGFVFARKHIEFLPAAGGEYVEAVVGAPQTINPIYAANRNVDGDLSRLIFSSLFRYDSHGRLQEDLVESWELSEDGKEYTLRIRPGVRWHDGGALTAADVIFTLNLIQNPDYHSSLRPGLASVKAELMDEQTLKLLLPEPFTPFRELLTFGVLPRAHWEGVSPAAAVVSDLNLKPIGSGPLRFQSLVRNTAGAIKEYKLVPNEHYYGPKPYLKSVIFKFYPEYNEAVKALNDNQAMGMGYLPFEQRANLLAQNSLRLHELAQPQIVSIFFNQSKNKSLADKEVRQALARAIDKEAVINQVFGGAYRRADGPLLSDSEAYNPDLTSYDYQPDEAKGVLEGKEVALTLTIVSAGRNQEVAEMIRSFWESAGVKVEIRAVASEEAADIVKSRDFEAILYGQAVGGDPDIFAFWHSTQAGERGLNLANYNNADVDRLLSDARIVTDEADRLMKYRTIQEYITADLPAIFIYSPIYTYVQDKRLQGFAGEVLINRADRFYGIGNWYIKTDKRIKW